LRAASSGSFAAVRTVWTNAAPHLRAEAGAPHALIFGYVFVVLHVLGDGDFPRLARLDLAVNPLQQTPAIRDVVVRIVVVSVNVANPAGGVEAQPITLMLL